ncbi:MAG: hypothetical protein ABW069_09285 [Duganella sp.]
MKIIDHRHIDSDNRYSTQPCLLSILEVDDTPSTPAALASFNRRLLDLLPGVQRQAALVGLRAEGVPHIVRVVQQVAMELRRLALNEVSVGFVGVVPRTQGRYRMVLPYAATARNAAAPALRIATQMVSALRAGQPFNLQAAVARLRALADRRVLPRAAAAGMAAAA